MKYRNCALAVLVITLATEARAQAPSESFYIQGLISYAKSAAIAVACGDRPTRWGQSVHAKMVTTLTEHAGVPMESAHHPSDAEREIALRSLARNEAAGVADGSKPYMCKTVREMILTDLDDFEDGAVPLWPDYP